MAEEWKEVTMDLDIIPGCGDQTDLMTKMELKLFTELENVMASFADDQDDEIEFKKCMDLLKQLEEREKMDVIPGFGDQIHLMTEMQLQFLSEVVYVLTYDENDTAIRTASLLENEMKFKEWMALMSSMEMDGIDKNSEIIIKHLISVRSARENFLQNYPKWAAVRKDAIKKLKRISVSVKLLRLTSNFLVLLGGSALLASFFIIPFSSSMSKIQLVCGNTLIAAVSLAIFGTKRIKELKKELTQKELKKAQEVIEEAKISSMKMKILLNPAVDSEKKLSKSMRTKHIDCGEEAIIFMIKELVDIGMKIKDDHLRLDYIKRTLSVLKSHIRHVTITSFIELVNRIMRRKDPHPRLGLDRIKRTNLKKISGFYITALKFIPVQVGKFLLLSNREKVLVTERAKILMPLTTEIDL